MSVTYGFYNSLNHDRLYDAIQMSSIFDGIILDGVFSTIGESLIVTAPGDGMYVNVGPGRAWFNHTWTLNDAEYPIQAQQSELVLDRIDAVVLEVNASSDVRANSIKIVKGLPASVPVKPTMVHTAELNQYALAYITINAGATVITQDKVENAVGTDETPFITGLLQQLSISEILIQWAAEWDTYFADFKHDAEADMAAEFAEFDDWFEHMKGQLSEDAAGHLQNEIDEINAVTTFAVDLQNWTADSTSQTGVTLYKKAVSISHAYTDCPVVGVGCASGSVLPTTEQQGSYELIEYVTVDDTIPCLYLYASSPPAAAFYIKVKGCD